jgi:hypothetical protein
LFWHTLLSFFISTLIVCQNLSNYTKNLNKFHMKQLSLFHMKQNLIYHVKLLHKKRKGVALSFY